MANPEQNPIIRRTSRRVLQRPEKKSERAEHFDFPEDRFAAKKTSHEGHLPKVMLSTEAREEEHREKEAHLSALMKRIHPEQQGEWVPAPAGKSENARTWADRRINTFTRRLQEKHITEAEMDGFGEEFVKMKNDIEQLQSERSEDENFKAIERLENAIHASKLTPKDALHELAYGVGVKRVELEEEATATNAEDRAHEYAKKITQRYGVSPEDFLNGNASIGARLKLSWDRAGSKLLAWTARLSGMEPAGMKRLRTDFDRWQEAQRDIQSGELARNERLPQAKKRRTSVEERTNEKTYDEDIVIEKDRAFAKEALGERAAELFNEVKSQMEFLHGEKAERFPFTAEAYVVNAAHYVDALDNNLKGGIKEYGATLREMNKDLGWPADSDPRTPRIIEPSPEDVTLIEEPKVEQRRSSRRRIPEHPKFEPMSVSKAQEILPDAHGLWEYVKTAYAKAPANVQLRLSNEDLHRDGITNFVLLAARVMEAQKAKKTDVANTALAKLTSFAKDLGIPENRMLIPPSSKPNNKLGVMRGPFQRQAASVERQRRSTF